MNCLKPYRIYKNLNSNIFPDGLKVPCGQCLQCRIAKKREWTVRMLQESSYHEKKMFLTLTYDDNHLPEFNSLRKSDLQKFYKKVRKSYPNKIKYFACGEYGPETQRPHYHQIIFGIGLLEKQIIIDSWPFCDWNQPTIRKKSFGIVTRESIQYVAGYIIDKLNGKMAKDEYFDKNREPVFRVMSNGIGKQFALDNQEDLNNKLYMTVNGIKMNLPRYYQNQINVDKDRLINLSVVKEHEENANVCNEFISDLECYKNHTKEYIKNDIMVNKKRLQKEKNIKSLMDKHSSKKL